MELVGFYASPINWVFNGWAFMPSQNSSVFYAKPGIVDIIVSSSSLLCHIMLNRLTRITRNAATLFDNICCNISNMSNSMEAGQCEYCKSPVYILYR